MAKFNRRRKTCFVKDRLREMVIDQKVDLSELLALADLLERKRNLRAPLQFVPDEVVRELVAYRRRHPELPDAKIAARYPEYSIDPANIYNWANGISRQSALM